MRPARSSTATCFCTAAKLISYRAARSDTDGVSVSDRARMSRRVPSAKARKSWLSDSSLSFRNTTIWLYVTIVRSLLQRVLLLCAASAQFRFSRRWWPRSDILTIGGYLSDDAGSQAETAFHRFASLVDSH